MSHNKWTVVTIYCSRLEYNGTSWWSYVNHQLHASLTVELYFVKDCVLKETISVLCNESPVKLLLVCDTCCLQVCRWELYLRQSGPDRFLPIINLKSFLLFRLLVIRNQKEVKLKFEIKIFILFGFNLANEGKSFGNYLA